MFLIYRLNLNVDMMSKPNVSNRDKRTYKISGVGI